MSIKKRGSKYVVTDSSGRKTLGTHSTRAAALRQLRAIEISKHAGEPGATKPKKSRRGKK